MMPASRREKAARRPPALHLPYPFLDYVLSLPGDHAKLILRLLQLAQWRPGVTPDGTPLDAGEVLISYRSRRIWDRVELDRDVHESGRVSLIRRLLHRLERDGFAEVKPAQRTDTRSGPGTGARSDTPATIVRFLKNRDILWPTSSGATHQTAQAAAQGRAHPGDTIPAVEPPADPPVASLPAHAGEAAQGGQAGPGASRVKARDPDVEWLRVTVAELFGVPIAEFPVSPSSKLIERQAKEAALKECIDRLGRPLMLDACKQIADEQRAQGVEVVSLAFFPGWLKPWGMARGARAARAAVPQQRPLPATTPGATPQQKDIRVGVAAPAPAAAFGQGGRRAWND